MSFRLPCPACGAPVPLDDGAACAGCRTELRRDGGVIVLDDVAGEGAYPPGLYPLDERVEERHWWHASRNAVIERALAPWRRRRGLATLVEVGCGTGFVLRHLERMGFAVAGIDMQIDGLRIAAARTEAPLVRTGAGRISFVDPVDVVALCDVLEHAEEEPLLASCRDALRPGGVLLVTVPARPSLWSLEDVLVGHRRRYTRRTLRAALERAGLNVLVNRPFHAWLTPLAWWGARRAGPIPDPVPDVRAAMEAMRTPPSRHMVQIAGPLCAVENWIGARVVLPFGSHLLALAERRD